MNDRTQSADCMLARSPSSLLFMKMNLGVQQWYNGS
jgi:hypothetical protein